MRNPLQPKTADAGANSIFHIRSEFDSMSKSFKKIARYIMDNPEKASAMSITMLARYVGASASTITRFCQTLGYSGYPQFRFDFYRTPVSTAEAERTLEQGDPPSVVKEKLALLYRRSIEETLERLDNSVVERIADLVSAADKVFFFGQFGNGVSARLGEALFMQVGITAFAYTDISLASVAAAHIGENDIAIGLSSSGQAKTPIDSLRIARNAGRITIGITGFANSPLAEQSEILLCYNLGVEDVRLVHIDRICNYKLMEKSLKMAKDAFLNARYTDP